MWDFLSGPVRGLVDGVGSVIDQFHTSEEEKSEARRALAELERDFHKRVLDAETEWAKTQASVIKAEVQGKSWLARNWRPILMLTFTYIIAHNYVFSTVFGFQPLEIPPDMWGLLKIGIGGYITGRSAEKIIPGVMSRIQKNSE